MDLSATIKLSFIIHLKLNHHIKILCQLLGLIFSMNVWAKLSVEANCSLGSEECKLLMVVPVGVIH